MRHLAFIHIAATSAKNPHTIQQSGESSLSMYTSDGEVIYISAEPFEIKCVGRFVRSQKIAVVVDSTGKDSNLFISAGPLTCNFGLRVMERE
jgi:hypothetical protein